MQRSVHVDSEPKVVHSLIANQRSRVRKKNVLAGKRGRGSNWAMGYYGLQSKGDDTLVENTIDAVRHVVERCDSFTGTVVMHSLAGGTGSGLGSRLCECLRDEYPMNYLLSCAIAPFASGESPLQHYNSLLTLSHLQRYCDGVIVSYNDEVLKRLEKGTDRSVSFEAVNRHIAGSLCGVFLPTDTLLSKCGYSSGQEPFELLRAVCPMPAHKFIHLLHHSKKKTSWEELLKETLYRLRRYDEHGKLFSSLANVMVARGQDSSSINRIQPKLKSKIQTAYNCVRWNPFPVDVWTATSNMTSTRDSSSVTIAANYGCCVEHLDTVIKKSKIMYDAGAYLHWYWRYGLTQEMFDESFETLQSTIDEYQTALSP
ncbi:tubulin delta chain-like isoform X2 [Gigantopelta aegis]|nr:tubulin delta chain-like isoform X2 [Gigantopelta aegis]